MEDKHIRIVITLEKKALVLGLGILILGAWIGQAVSETVTMTTYYPAPAGVYQKLTTTGGTVLARDSGSVGVGTATPSQKFHVYGGTIYNDVNGDIRGLSLNQLSAAHRRTAISFQDAATEQFVVGVDLNTNNNRNLFFYDAQAGANRMIIQSDGNIGIGTNAPTQTLDVNGVIRMNGFIIPPVGSDPASPLPGQIWMRS